MSANSRWGDLPLLADTSAWTNLARTPQEVQRDLEDGLRSQHILTSPIVRLELLHDARDRAAFERTDERLAALRELPLAAGIGQAAIAALRQLSGEGPPGHHRVPLPDALVAATAAERGYAVLFYDRHFDKLATVLGFQPVWLVPRGTI